jgi:hypothetical protein
VQKVHGVEALLRARTDSTEAARRWLLMVSSAVARAWEQSRAESRERRKG